MSEKKHRNRPIPTVSTISSVLAAASMVILTSISPAQAQSGAKGKSGLPLPRFVSLKSQRINMRVGPGKDYKVNWLYLKKGLPMEIIQEFDHWRKVRDPEGQEGWIYHSLLSGKRTAIVSPWNRENRSQVVDLRESPSESSAMVAKLEPGVIAKISYCEFKWCAIEVDRFEGFVEQSALWGVYPDETVED